MIMLRNITYSVRILGLKEGDYAFNISRAGEIVNRSRS